MLENLNLPNLHFVHPGTPGTRIFWPYLVSAVMIAGTVFLIKRDKRVKLSLKNFFKFTFPKSIYLHKSAVLDYIYFFLNQIVHGLLFLPFIVTAPAISVFLDRFLTRTFGSPEIQLISNFWTRLTATLLAAVLADFGRFLGHYLNHRIPFLWNFHKVHHSAEVLTPITVYRAHPVELIIMGNAIALATGLVFGIFNYFSETPIGLITILQLNVIIFLFNLIGSNLRHSHIWISYPRFLSHIFISPAQHQIHHSLNPAHVNKNFGSVFAIWDYLFKSLYIPKTQESFEIGLTQEEHKEFSNLWRFYLLPFKKNLGLFFKKKIRRETLKA